MPILVDTSVWSHAFRRRRGALTIAQKRVVTQLHELIADGQVVLLGMVRQEILSGVRSTSEFTEMRNYLANFEDETLDSNVYVLAAECHNKCRAAGIQGSAIDFLICATSIARGFSIFTLDRDFTGFAKYLPIRLHEL
jgi:predicted nucleic acid-binding protein